MMFRISMEEYNYNLPEERIAQYPLEERDGSRMLVYRDGKISGNLFRDIHEFIPENSLLVFNNTKVIRARLLFFKDTGATIEIFLLEPVSPPDYSLVFSAREEVEWVCLIGNLKRWKGDLLVSFFGERDNIFKLTAEKLKREGDSWRIRFRWDNSSLTFGEVIETAGHVPLPPYIRRKDERSDAVSYQTIFSMVKGSVAAPTAGLHFTKSLLDNLRRKGIQTAELTLHVGAGTFQPVKSDNITSHEMHSEHFLIGSEVIEAVLKNTGRIIAVGTTSVRTLESLYWIGVKLAEHPDISPSSLFLDQWEAYSLKKELSPALSLESILSWMQRMGQKTLKVPTRIIIVPGYDFTMIDGMITNFHLPKSTLLLLVSAWTGSKWKAIYDFALANDFRFLSYGDSSLLLK